MNPILPFFLAALLLLLGVALWLADRRAKRAAASPERRERPADPDESEHSEPAPSDSAAEPDRAPQEPQPEERAHEKDSDPLDVEVEAEGVPADAATSQNAVLQERLESATVGPPPDRDRKSRPFTVPGAARRERKSWAQGHGFSYDRSDSYLDDEWTRGAAAGGDSARDVVSGVLNNREFYLLDLGDTPVMAVHRVGESSVVVDFRRGEFRGGEAEDLLPCGNIEGFAMFSTEQGAAARFVDERVCAALEAMPPVVDAVWLEGGWVLAQLDRASRAEDWDMVIAPLTLLADAAPVLPPKEGTERPLEVNPELPSRLMAAGQVRSEPDEEDGVADEKESPRPLVARPEEPLDLPQRAETTSRGVVQPRSLGGDEVEAIGEDPEAQPADDRHGTRMLRNLSGGSSIFDDLAAELGGDPLGGDAADEDRAEKNEPHAHRATDGK